MLATVQLVYASTVSAHVRALDQVLFHMIPPIASVNKMSIAMMNMIAMIMLMI